MIRKLRKGFTIVELVIVISVIAVLTAVLIPTFVHLSKKAKLASDNSLVSNLNTALQMDKGEGHAEPKTMQEAVEAVKRQGYLVPQLATKSEEKLVYSIEKNEFCLSDKVAEGEEYKYWHIEKGGMPSSQLFSIYAFEWTETAATDLTVGFDAGEEEGIVNVSFVRGGGSELTARDVIIRTNSAETALTVNAPKDTIRHYDYLDELTVTAVASASYHEYGTVRGKAVISQGHIVVESGSSVSQVSVKEATGAVKVTANQGTLVNVDSASSTQASVVANSSDVFVSGLSTENISGSKASSVELPTVVTTETELESAIVAKKGFIQIGADFSASQHHEFADDALLDFAGHTITSSLLNNSFITNSASMRLVDSAANGGITSANNNVIVNTGNMTIDGAKLAGNRLLTSTEEQGAERGVVYNSDQGKLVINNIDLYIKADYGVLNYGQMTINGGTYNSDADSNAFSSARYGYCVSSLGGHMVINNATVSGIHGCISVSGGTGVINNAHAETRAGAKASSSYRALYIAGEVSVAGVEINGGYFKSYSMEALLTGNKSDGGVGALAMSTIHGGTFINGKGGSEPAVKVSGGAAGNNYGIGMMTITGGKFSSNVTGATGVVSCVQGTDGLWVVNA